MTPPDQTIQTQGIARPASATALRAADNKMVELVQLMARRAAEADFEIMLKAERAEKLSTEDLS